MFSPFLTHFKTLQIVSATCAPGIWKQRFLNAPVGTYLLILFWVLRQPSLVPKNIGADTNEA